VPTDKPVTIPVAEPIVPTAGLTDDHIPPPDASASVVVIEVDKVVFPVIAVGNELTVTVTVAVLLQPATLVPVTV
jgi:hypothetical protein